MESALVVPYGFGRWYPWRLVVVEERFIDLGLKSEAMFSSIVDFWTRLGCLVIGFEVLRLVLTELGA